MVKFIVKSIIQKLTVQFIGCVYSILTSTTLRRKKQEKHKYIFLLANVTKKFIFKAKLVLRGFLSQLSDITWPPNNTNLKVTINVGYKKKVLLIGNSVKLEFFLAMTLNG